MKLVFFSMLFSISSSVFADNHLLVIGGGGEPERDFTIFDTGLETLGKNLQKAKWKYEVSFNGGHQKTEDIMRRNFTAPSVSNSDFTAEKYSKLIKDYKEKILNGTIKSGDQLMVIIDSHGAAQTKDSNTHTISASGIAKDLDNLEGTKLVNLDDLSELVKLTNERGIKLGIVDLSCHSGNTMALKINAPNTCIVTATGPLHYGFAGPSAFTDKFLANLTPGVNLEEAFLKARLQSADAAYPMISTNENDEIVKDVYSKITPYLYYYDADHDKVTPYVMKTNTPDLLCQREDDFKKLINQIDLLKAPLKSAKNSYNGDELKNLLIQYKASQDAVIKASLEAGGGKMSTVETFTFPSNTQAIPFIKMQYTWKELVDLNIDARVAEYEKYRDFSTVPKYKQDNQNALDFLKTIKVKRQQIIDSFPHMKDLAVATKQLVSQMDKSREIADKIAAQEKKFYEELYRRKQSTTTNNPCRSIVF